MTAQGLARSLPAPSSWRDLVRFPPFSGNVKDDL